MKRHIERLRSLPRTHLAVAGLFAFGFACLGSGSAIIGAGMTDGAPAAPLASAEEEPEDRPTTAPVSREWIGFDTQSIIPSITPTIGATTGATPAGDDFVSRWVNTREGAISPPKKRIPGGSRDPREEAPPPTLVNGGNRFQLPLLYWDMVTDRFGAPRANNLVHGGIDLALAGAPASPVLASCTGQVTTASENESYGRYVVIDCGEGWETLYGHMSALVVAKGAHVTKGDVLGLSGSTGFSTGEHLHFEIHYNGAYLNPEDYLDFGIPPGTPLSNGPIIVIPPTIIPTPETITPGGTTPGASTPGTSTPGTTPAPGGTTTPPPTTSPTATPTPPNYTVVDQVVSSELEIEPLVVAAGASAHTWHARLQVNRVPAGWAIPPADATARATCAGCSADAVLVQLNLVTHSDIARAELQPAVQVGDCGSCRATVRIVDITVVVSDPSAPPEERVKGLYDAIDRALREYGSADPAVGGKAETIDALIAYIEETYPAMAQSMRVIEIPDPDAPTPTPTPEDNTPPTATPTPTATATATEQTQTVEPSSTTTGSAAPDSEGTETATAQTSASAGDPDTSGTAGGHDSDD